MSFQYGDRYKADRARHVLENTAMLESTDMASRCYCVCSTDGRCLRDGLFRGMGSKRLDGQISTRKFPLPL
jgi:hypothetical protein